MTNKKRELAREPGSICRRSPGEPYRRPERTITRTTGHTSVETLKSYIDDAELFTDPASSYLDL